VSEKLTELLKINKIDARITGREKTPFSFFFNMQSRKLS
jgi:(p)ppGpp synthase/HD superfamily hydrolase